MTLSRKAPDVRVEFEGHGNVDWAEVLSIDASLGGRSVDTAVFTFKHLRRHEFQVQDTTLYNMLDRWAVSNPIVRISIQTRDETYVVVHRGQLVAVNYDITSNGEQVTYTSRMDWHLLGTGGSKDEVDWEEWSYMKVGSAIPLGATVVWGTRPRGHLCFNPFIDGIAIPNCRLVEGWPYYFDEEALPRASIQDLLLVGLFKYWTLAEIVFYVLGNLNREEAFVSNVSLENLKKTLDNSEYLVRDLDVDLTRPINEILDSILEPYSYTWWVDHNAVDGDPSQFAFLSRRSKENERLLIMQRYWEDAHSGPGATAAKAISLQYDVSSNSANQFYVIQGGTVVEGTFELYPAWDQKYDSLEAEDLEETDEEVELEPAKKRVWREWVLNESGEYDDVLAARELEVDLGFLSLIDTFDALNTDGICNGDFELQPPIRREFISMLTLDDDGSPKGSGTGGVAVEYSDDGGGTWNKIDDILPNNFSISVLRGECGIRFSSDERTLEEWMYMRDKYDVGRGTYSLWDKKFKIRVTASVMGNPVIKSYRLKKKDLDESFLSWQKPYFIGMEQMHSSVVSKTSIYYDSVHDGTLDSSEVDLTAFTEDEVKRAADTLSLASCTGTVTLEGIEYGVQWLGTTIEKLWPREVDLTVSPPNANTFYPMVIAVRYDLPKQETTLTLDIDRTIPQGRWRSTRRARASTKYSRIRPE